MTPRLPSNHDIHADAMETPMKPPRSRLSLLLAVTACVTAFDAAAVAQRTFVASYGLGANTAVNCSVFQPCRTFAEALSVTVPGGEIIVLDSAGYGAVTVTQPVTIHAPPGIYAGVSVFSGAGIIVNAPAAKVTLRGLSITGLGGATGVELQAADTLFVDNVVLSGFSGAGAAGLRAAPAGAATLLVRDSQLRDNATALALTSAATITASVERTGFDRNATAVAVTDNVQAEFDASSIAAGATGLSVQPGGAATSRVQVRGTSFYGNSGNAVVVGGGASANASVSLVSSQLAANGTGLRVQGGAAAYSTDTTITRNATGVSTTGGATAVSAGDNRLLDNTTNGAFTSVQGKQ